MAAMRTTHPNNSLQSLLEHQPPEVMRKGFDMDDAELDDTRCFTRGAPRQCQAGKAPREADSQRGEFLATLAHELRNPLAAVRNALQLLNVAGCPEVTARMARGIMDRQVQQISRLVEDVLDISRITQNKVVLRKERVDLAFILGCAVETSRPAIDAAGHQLSIALPATPLILEADPSRLAQVFSNLLNNSAKYTAPRGRIRIEAEQQGSDVVVTVRDNGVGISNSALTYIFDMFRQIDRSRELSQGGLGIGLTLVRRLVELHGGTITANSDVEGTGSEFIVRLSAAAHDARTASSPFAKRLSNRSFIGEFALVMQRGP